MQIADYVACVIAGSLEPESRLTRKVVLQKAKHQTGSCSIFGTSLKTYPDDAALTNGIQAHVLDYDDVSQTMYGHPSASILPAVFAIAEERGCSGKELLIGFIVGCEVAAIIGRIINPVHYQNGWHATCTLGSIGASSAVVKLLGMTKVEARKALGVSASFSSGLKQNFGTPMKAYHAGRAAENGVRAAMLIEQGWSANENIFDEGSDFFQAYGAVGEGDTGVSEIDISFDNPFDIIQPGITFKKYPSCAFTHPAIDAALEIKNETSLSIADISEVEVRINQMASDALNHKKATSGLEGKFSIEYCVASALLRGNCRLADFTAENVLLEDVQDLSRKIRRSIIEKPVGVENIFGPAEVKVVYKNGSAIKKRIEIAKGDPNKPLNSTERFEKYQDCLSGVYGNKVISQTYEMINNLEGLAAIDELTAMFRKTSEQ